MADPDLNTLSITKHLLYKWTAIRFCSYTSTYTNLLKVVGKITHILSNGGEFHGDLLWDRIRSKIT